MKMFEVGGCVRDELLGTPSKDIDFSVVLEPLDVVANWPDGSWMSDRDPFERMEELLVRQGFKLIPEARRPEFLTARGFFPKDHSVYPGKPADFVLARKEGAYSDGRRPDKVEIGTLEDDLARRDFTMNAIAKDSDGNIVDPFNGLSDIDNKVIRAVGHASQRLNEDALRAVRALRFSVTKGFSIQRKLRWAMETVSVLDSIANKIADERIEQELSKMFRFNTLKSLEVLNEFPQLTAAMFSGSVSLDATMKTKGRG